MADTDTRPAGTFLSVRPTRFDLVVGLVILGLAAAIGVTLLLGDRVGVQIDAVSPTALASSTTSIALTFSEAMQWETVIERLQYAPALDGTYAWNNKTLRFTPAEPLQSGAEYAVTLVAGAESSGSRAVLEDASFSFRVRPSRVAYLMPADAVPANIWLSEPGVEDSAEQVTFSPTGILNFDVSPDGTTIAFSERSALGTADIKLLDLQTGSIRQVSNCVDSDCNTPVWRPDGSMIAYHRIDLNSDFTDLGVSPTRVWLIDLTTSPPDNRPLFSDNQILGYSPQWSADSNRVSIYDTRSESIVVYDFTDESIVVVPAKQGGSEVALAPDGQRVVFNQLSYDDTGSMHSVLKMADFQTNTVADLTDPDQPVDDTQSVWHPDGRYLAVARRYTDDRATRTRQLFLLDTETGTAQPLVYDAHYFSSFFAWHPRGDQLVFYRFPEAVDFDEDTPPPRPEVWTYDMPTETLLRVAQNAYFPTWVP